MPYDTQDQDSQSIPPTTIDTTDTPGSQDEDGDITSGMRPETADFLNNLSGIGAGAFLAMRQADTPEYEDWRDGNFTPDGSGNYVSREGQAYTDDELEGMHGVLSRQAGNPLVSGLFEGPKSPWADYMAWRNQNYLNDNEVGGAWEDEDGNLFSEPALQEMFNAKFAGQPDGPEQAEEGAAADALSQNQKPVLPAQDQSQAGTEVSQMSDALTQASDFEKWKNQNFRPTSDGRWEGPDARVYTDQDLRSIYAIQQQKWPKQQAQSAQSRGTTVTLTYPDGTIESRTGNHPQRDNNPGNMKDGSFARSQGSIGVDQDKRFAIFPSPEAGWAAMDARLKTADWQNTSVDKAIEAWAPKNDGNDTEKYKRQVRAALGVAGATRISQLTPQQFETLKQTIAQVEGFYEQRPGRKVKVVIQPPMRPDVIPKN